MPTFWKSSRDNGEASNLRHELAQMREANEKLQHELAQMAKSSEKLQASHVYQKDEIRSLKGDACSKEQEITQLLEKLQARSKEQDIPEHNRNGQMLENLQASIQAREVEIRVLREDALSHAEVITKLNRKVRALREDALSYTDVITRLNEKVRVLKQDLCSYGEEITMFKQQVEVLKEGERSYKQKIATLDQKVGVLRQGERSYTKEIITLKQNVQKLEEVAAEVSPFVIIGKDVRLRFLEHRVPRRKGKDLARIKSGNSAAHRGRPVVDALLLANGDIDNPSFMRQEYENLYGVSPETMLKWKDVPEMEKVTGFRGSLQCNKKLSEEFRVSFDRLKTLAAMVRSSPELREEFEAKGRVNKLQQLYGGLLNCFDKIVAEKGLDPPKYVARRAL